MINKIDLIQEFNFNFSRSSGSGGQHVNKVNTKVELRFSIDESNQLSPIQKKIIHRKLANKINQAGILILTADNSRSQQSNKEATIEKFFHLIEQALKPKKKRIKTKPGKTAIEKRLQAKKQLAQKKANRKKHF